MNTTITRKGQITIPKKIRAALDRFERARGRATVKWKTDELMALLRRED